MFVLKVAEAAAGNEGVFGLSHQVWASAEVKTGPEAVPLPPRVTLKRARSFRSPIGKGDPGSGRVIAETAAQGLNAFIGKKE